MKIGNALRLGAEILINTGRNIPAYLEAKLLLRHVLGYSQERLLVEKHSTITAKQYNKFIELINKRASTSIPIAYLLGKKEFYGMEFLVTPDVLIPRPDSEILIDEALKFFDSVKEDMSILDLGVGSGCLLLTLLKHLPHANGVAVDISSGAIAVAKQNYAALQLKNDIEFINADWNSISFNEKFDLIISNPPYISVEELNSLIGDVKNHEPRSALEAAEEGLKCYKDIMPIIAQYLKKDGYAILECGMGQSEQVVGIGQSNNLSLVKTQKDLGGITRCVILKNDL